MSEVQLLTEQIEVLHLALKPLGTKFMVLMFAGITMGTFGFLFGAIMQNVGWAALGGLGIVLLVIAFGVVYPGLIESQEEYSELVKQRDELIKQTIKDMGCDEMRLDIIDKIENGQEWYTEEHYDMEKDLYYHRCEIPLRDEVLKLQ